MAESEGRNTERLWGRLEAMEREIAALKRENAGLRQAQGRGARGQGSLSRRGLFLGGGSLVAAAAGGTLLDRTQHVLAAGSGPATTINYQGRLTDNTGNPVNNTNLSITFRLYADASDSIGAALWSDTYPVSVINGLFSTYLGSHTSNPLYASYLAGTPWLGIQVAGDSTELTPREQLGSSPYGLLGQPNGIATLDGNGLLVQSSRQGIISLNYYTLTADTGTLTSTSWMNIPNFPSVTVPMPTNGTANLGCRLTGSVYLDNRDGNTYAIQFQLLCSDNTALSFGLFTTSSANANGDYGHASVAGQNKRSNLTPGPSLTYTLQYVQVAN